MRARSPFLLWLLPAIALAQAPQQQLNDTLQHLADTKKDDAALQEKLQHVQKEFETLRTHSAELAERLQVSERRVGNEEQALAAVNSRLATKQKEFDARKADYATTITTLLRMRELPTTALFSQPDNIQQLLRTASVLEKTNAAIAAKARALSQDLAELKALKTEASARRTRTLAETATLNDEQAQLEKALTTRQKLEEQLSVDHSHAEEKIAALSHQSQSLQALIGKLDKQAREQVKEKTSPVKATPPRKLETAKGSLRAPVLGDILHRFGERKSDNETYRGMVFHARAGSTVVAPYDGEVVFTGPFRDYGNMVLIKHQNGYISLIAGVGKVTATLNQTVIRGEPIAVMGSGAHPEAYVELRDSDAKPIDPGEWFANVKPVVTQK